MNALGFGPTLALRYRRGGQAAFDFTGGVLPAGATLARASPATRVDASGTTVTEPAGTARFDHDPATGALLGLLIEPAATNLAYCSTDLTSGWTLTRVTATATRLSETTVSGGHAVQITAAFAAGATYTLSAVAAEVAGAPKRYLVLTLPSSGFGSSPAALYDLAAGTFVNTTPDIASADMRNLGGGRWLVALTATANGGSGLLNLRTSTSATSPSSGAGSTAAKLDLSEIQFEAAPVASSRIRTTTASASRAADVLTLEWSRRGVADGAVVVRYTFDDGSSQDVAATVSGGATIVPTTLARPRIVRAQLV